MRIKGVGHLMLLGGLFVSHVIGLPMNGHESHQGDVGIDIVTIPMPVNPMADEEKRKAEALERYDIVKEWLGTLIPKGLELGQPELVYTPAEEPFKVWKEQIGLANKLLNKLKERQKKRKGNPPFKAYDVIRKNNHMKQFCEALKPFLELMIEVLQYLKDRSKPVCKVFSRKASLANELWKTQEHLFKVQLSCLEILPNADDVTYAFIREFFATSLDKAIAAELEQNDKLTKKIVSFIEGWVSTGSVEVVENHPDQERSASTRCTPDDDQSSLEPSASHHHSSYQPARRKHPGNGRSSRRSCRIEQERSSESDRSVNGQSIGFAQDRDHMSTSSSNSRTALHHDSPAVPHSPRGSGVRRLPN
ncbi:hypothetical protein SeLEV6574_g02887 [Synchytrium endobioticum]|uniref:Secreted protein n=1 Tax=Synchytrium endobioticum TaxID=286115 RepID=A0A507D857_9FUNG|nr:hypothetical protein SeLEV6574_g02887 [Synchytrium endobioticum]